MHCLFLVNLVTLLFKGAVFLALADDETEDFEIVDFVNVVCVVAKALELTSLPQGLSEHQLLSFEACVKLFDIEVLAEYDVTLVPPLCVPNTVLSDHSGQIRFKKCKEGSSHLLHKLLLVFLFIEILEHAAESVVTLLDPLVFQGVQHAKVAPLVFQ